MKGCRCKRLNDSLNHGQVEHLIPAQVVALAEGHRNEANAAGPENALELLHCRNKAVAVGFRMPRVCRVQHLIVETDVLDRRNAGDSVENLIGKYRVSEI